ncbi:DUF4013 domain-containing protein [uncultured Methanobrevibacter sp.]|uniref:DUF4013 domain-containing protein n=1 Tax=uncultured Methanobrevibacter sp. TaxID=253161 RepID=UPI0025D206CF|nr:DUF4013 domain-containing protein [uncultured Methanobrevibacter sp.]
MELMEIISDALVYPFHNIKALIIYLILGIILGIVWVGSMGAAAASAAASNLAAAMGSAVIGFIVAVIISFAISGYQLDIIKYGIDRSFDAPGLDFVRQFFNGFKLTIVQLVYFIIPIIISAILAIIFQHWLAMVIEFILFVIFGLAAFMAECRLAKTEDIGYALSIGDAIGDITKVGILKLIVFIVIVALIAFLLSIIGGFISGWNSTVGGIFLGALGIYLVFFAARAAGLLYSNV